MALLLAAPPALGDPVVAAAGDIACGPGGEFYNSGLGDETHCRQRYTADLVAGSGARAVLPLGDEQYCCGSLAQFNAVYDQTWGRVRAITHPAVGNHEYETPGAAGYFDYFNGVGNYTGPAGDRDKGYYSFDVNGWHLVALNSNCGALAPGAGTGGCAAGSAQEEWLRADLAAHPSACTLAYWHHPRFSSEFSHSAMGAIWSDLYAAGAEVVLSGHEHNYERFLSQNATGAADPRRGVTQFVVGTGGRSFTSTRVPITNSQVLRNDTFGILALTLHLASYDWRFVPEAGGTFTDSGSASCHGAASGVRVPLGTGVTPLTVGGRGTPVQNSARGARLCTIVGSPLDDVLTGTPDRDTICGLAGDDVISGLGGNDIVVAGPGNDTVLGAAGHDRLFGNDGKDVLKGGSGPDRLIGGHGRDRLFGEDGRDVLDGGAGDDRLEGSAGRDRLWGGHGADRIFAVDGHGLDRVKGGRGRDKATVDRGDRVHGVERRRVVR